MFASVAVAQDAPSPDAAAPPNESSLAMASTMQTVVRRAIDRSAASVVAIARVPRNPGFDAGSALQFNLPGLNRPLIDPDDPDFVPMEFASGVIISPEGDVLTCYHALGDPTKNDYYVWSNGQAFPADVQQQPFPARVSAGDPWTDLAVLKIDGENLPVMPLGDAIGLRRGDFVVALGNPYAIARDGRASASFGIVANLQRAAVENAAAQQRDRTIPAAEESIHRYGTLIQTDAKLNLGTSGGALLNLKGEMVGLTTSLAAVAGYEQAAGYAIPIDPAMQEAIKSLREGRQPAFGFLGIEPIDAPNRRGAVVNRVVPGMPAATAGLTEGDLIIAVDQTPIHGAVDLFREMSRRPANQQTELAVTRAFPGREGQLTEKLTVRLGKKRLTTTRPAYESVAAPSWRGMEVDLATALPPQLLMRAPASRGPPVAVMEVAPDSAAWEAGLRAGQAIVSLADQQVATPQEFHRLTEAQQGPVTIEILTTGGQRQRLVVEEDDP